MSCTSSDGESDLLYIKYPRASLYLTIPQVIDSSNFAVVELPEGKGISKVFKTVRGIGAILLGR